jgi:hypothetical protein
MTKHLLEQVSTYCPRPDSGGRAFPRLFGLSPTNAYAGIIQKKFGLFIFGLIDPTIAKAGRPGATCTCTSTARASIPSKATVETRWTNAALSRGEP